MSDSNKVVWSEGLFLRTQHLQQQDRYTEALVRGGMQVSSLQNFGFRMLSLDPEALEAGSVGIKAAMGVFPDGTPFLIPNTLWPRTRSRSPRIRQAAMSYLQSRPKKLELPRLTRPTQTPVERAIAAALFQCVMRFEEELIPRIWKLPFWPLGCCCRAKPPRVISQCRSSILTDCRRKAR